MKENNLIIIHPESNTAQAETIVKEIKDEEGILASRPQQQEQQQRE